MKPRYSLHRLSEDSDALLHEVRRAIAKSVHDETKAIAIRKAEANGQIEAPTSVEQEQLERLNALEQNGASIPMFFQIWKKILRREAVSQTEINELSLEDQQIACAILFKYHFYRGLHQTPLSPVANTAYAINLLWLDKPHNPPLGREQLSTRFISAVRSWRQGNNCSINIWYDGRLTDEKVISAATGDFRETPHSGKIRFRDLCEIDLSPIGILPGFFTHPHIYQYLKVDAAKALILDHTLGAKREVKYGVYVDLDPEGALSKDELFDEQTIQVLNRFGFIMALPGPGGPEDGYENCLMIFDRDKENVLKYHRELLKQSISVQLRKLNTYLTQGKPPDVDTRKSIIQGVYTIYMQLANREAIERLQLEHKASGEGPEAWRAKCEEFKKRAVRPPAKPVSFPPTTYNWN